MVGLQVCTTSPGFPCSSLKHVQGGCYKLETSLSYRRGLNCQKSGVGGAKADPYLGLATHTIYKSNRIMGRLEFRA